MENYLKGNRNFEEWWRHVKVAQEQMPKSADKTEEVADKSKSNNKSSVHISFGGVGYPPRF